MDVDRFKGVMPGDWVYCINEEDNGEFDYCGYLFMAICDNYIIVCCEDDDAEDNFKEQIRKMSEESAEYQGIEVYIYPAEKVFTTKSEAVKYLIS